MRVLLIGGTTGKFAQHYVPLLRKSYIEIVNAGRDWREHLASDFDGVIVATPAKTHFQIGLAFLNLGFPCLIEKPLCLTVEETKTLKHFEKQILVNYPHLFAPTFEKMFTGGGQQIVVQSTGPVKRDDVDQETDYGCHAFAMLAYKNVPVERAAITIGHSDRNKLFFSAGKQHYTATEQALPFVVDAFFRLIAGTADLKDRRYGVDISIAVAEGLTRWKDDLR
jgi:Oxidoreductase family, NAD-binding Rossmann fold